MLRFPRNLPGIISEVKKVESVPERCRIVGAPLVLFLGRSFHRLLNREMIDNSLEPT